MPDTYATLILPLTLLTPAADYVTRFRRRRAILMPLRYA